MESKNVPEIRFKGYTDAWVKRKLGEIADITKLAGFEFTKYVIYKDNGKMIALRGMNIKDGKIILNEVKYIDQSDLPMLSRSKLFQGDIIFTYVGTIGELAVIPENNRFYLAPNVARIRLERTANTDFISQQLRNSKFYDKVITPLIATSSQPALSMENIRKFNVMLTSYIEQSNIGNFFCALDIIITLYQQKLEKLKELKKGYLQKMFPKVTEHLPRIRFNEFANKWCYRRFKDVANFSKGNGYSKSSLKENGTPIILYGQLYTNYETIIENISTFAEVKKNSVLSKGGEVIVPSSGETMEDISRASVVNKSGVILGGDLNIIVVDTKEIEPIFLAIILTYGSQQKDLSRRAQGKSVVHLGNSDFKEMILLLPNKYEQATIGHFFSTVDQQITALSSKIERFRVLKASYLKKMFV